MRRNIHPCIFRALAVIFIISGTFVLSGCFTFNNLTTGRSLGKGRNEAGFSTSSYYAEETGMTPPFLLRGSYTRGLTQRWDLGGNLSLGGTLGLHTKYQVVGDQTTRFCMAPGISFEYFGFSISSSDSDIFVGYKMANLAFPLHLSYHPNDKLAVYLTPKYIATISMSSVSTPETENIGILGITPGIEFGKKVVIGLESNYLIPLSSGDSFSYKFFVLSAGCRWRFGRDR